MKNWGKIQIPVRFWRLNQGQIGHLASESGLYQVGEPCIGWERQNSKWQWLIHPFCFSFELNWRFFYQVAFSRVFFFRKKWQHSIYKSLNISNSAYFRVLSTWQLFAKYLSCPLNANNIGCFRVQLGNQPSKKSNFPFEVGHFSMRKKNKKSRSWIFF